MIGIFLIIPISMISLIRRINLGFAVVTQDYEIIDRRNPVSGHEWIERRPLKKWIVRGGTSTGESFRSERKAQEHADYLNKWCFMINAERMSLHDREYSAEASELGFAPGETPYMIQVMDCPEKGASRSFAYIGSDENPAGDATTFNYEEIPSPERSKDKDRGLAPLRIVVFND